MSWGYMWPMGWMFSVWIGVFALWVAMAWFVARATARASLADDSPETILKRRYARGEMSREEFERRLSDIRR